MTKYGGFFVIDKAPSTQEETQGLIDRVSEGIRNTLGAMAEPEVVGFQVECSSMSDFQRTVLSQQGKKPLESVGTHLVRWNVDVEKTG